VGTISVEKSEKLSRLLDKRGIAHEVLNAKQHTREAEIVSQAGRLSAVTVSTNMAGRGVDILLGGNPEGLALRDLRAKGIELETPEGQAMLAELEEVHTADTRAEGAKVISLGGLYVLGTERHESRRIDNQLRGRAGRQGDPGESRFYLSLEDDLMRLFATGAINWVMGKALPDDMPLEARMVSKAIERAQTTVEQKNGEIRKNVLKYDEVLDAQRKVIYALRDQILDRRDLRERIVTEHLPAAIQSLVDTYCVAEYHDEWDLAGLHAEMLTFWPSGLSMDQLSEATSRKELLDALLDDGVAHYEAREAELGAEVLRQVERQVMLRIIDTRWREHLFEMDYLQEGINLRAMGQRDPLTEWQREGYEMFGQMMQGIAQDLVRYVMHVQVQVSEPAKAQAAAAAVAAAEAAKVAAELADAPKETVDWGDADGPDAEEPTAAEVTLDGTTEAEVAEGETTEGTPEGEPAEEATGEAVPEGSETPDEAAEAAAGADGDAALEAEADAEQEPEGPATDAEEATAEPAPEPEIEIELSEELLAQIGGADAEVQILGYSMPDDPSAGSGMAATAAVDVGAVPGSDAEPETMTPVRKTEWEKTARNAPCPCGSGKKYKRCHGNAA
jgi:preprotein translocase subunit SecA